MVDVSTKAETARATGRAGVEIEALTAASVTCLTNYDMPKAAQKDLVIEEVRLVRKVGGKSGDWQTEVSAAPRC